MRLDCGCVLEGFAGITRCEQHAPPRWRLMDLFRSIVESVREDITVWRVYRQADRLADTTPADTQTHVEEGK